MLEVTVPLGARTYPVWVGAGARERITDVVGPAVRRVAVLTQEGVPQRMIPDFGKLPTVVATIGGGEEHKTLATVASVCSTMARAGITRSDLVVGVGGGMVTDVAGFVAATYHRGMRVAHVATTLLAMVDASIGGKTGVNLPEGKNLVGSFWQPVAVACDTEALETLSAREMACGMGEMAKYHFIDRTLRTDGSIEERIASCASIKASIVAEDEREGGRRALLNYGHTLAHALEIETGHRLAHGEAVALGILFAGHVAHEMGRIDDSRLALHHRVIGEDYGLRPLLPSGVGLDAMVDTMGRDKKSDGALTFVLDGASGLEVVHDVDEEVLRRAWIAFESHLVSLGGADRLP